MLSNILLSSCWLLFSMANVTRELFGLVFQGFRSPQKIHAQNSRPKVVGIPLQFHFLKPNIFSCRFSVYGGDQYISGSLHRSVCYAINYMWSPKCLRASKFEVHGMHQSGSSILSNGRPRVSENLLSFFCLQVILILQGIFRDPLKIPFKTGIN